MGDILNESGVLVDESGLRYYTAGLKSIIKKDLTFADYTALTTTNPYTDYYINDKKYIIKNGHNYLAESGNYFKTTTDQTITGLNTFTDDIVLKDGFTVNTNKITLPDKSGTLALIENILTNPDVYVKSTAVSGQSVIFTLHNDTTVTFTPELADDTMMYQGICKQSELAGKSSTASKGDYWFLSDYGGQSAVWNGSTWKYINSAITVDTNASTTSTNPIASCGVYNYVNNYHDSTKLSCNGSIPITGTLCSTTLYPIRSNNTSFIEVYGGPAWNQGGFLKLFNAASKDSRAQIFAHNGSTYKTLSLHATNDSISYDGQELFFKNAITPTFTWGRFNSNKFKNTSLEGIRFTAHLWFIRIRGQASQDLGATNRHWLFKNLAINGRKLVNKAPLEGVGYKDGQPTTGKGLVFWDNADKDYKLAVRFAGALGKDKWFQFNGIVQLE